MNWIMVEGEGERTGEKCSCWRISKSSFSPLKSYFWQDTCNYLAVSSEVHEGDMISNFYFVVTRAHGIILASVCVYCYC